MSILDFEWRETNHIPSFVTQNKALFTFAKSAGYARWHLARATTSSNNKNNNNKRVKILTVMMITITTVNVMVIHLCS